MLGLESFKFFEIYKPFQKYSILIKICTLIYLRFLSFNKIKEIANDSFTNLINLNTLSVKIKTIGLIFFYDQNKTRKRAALISCS